MKMMGKIKEDPGTISSFSPRDLCSIEVLLVVNSSSLKEASIQVLLLENRNVAFILFVVDQFHVISSIKSQK